MRWYDLFSRFYDGSLEKLYLEQRREAARALDLRPGLTVLDLPCGTGQSLDVLAPAVAPGGAVIGVDRSTGMLARAKARSEKNGWSHVRLVEGDVATLDAAALGGATVSVDRLHVFLGMTAFEDPDAAFERMWSLLRPGGRCVIVDAHAEKLGFQGRMVNLVAQADLRRRFWEPLEKRATGFSRRDLPSLPDHGGQIILAVGDKPD
jgi:ubiquinone/menaquinone biosynthesis C-methylase UbiE